MSSSDSPAQQSVGEISPNSFRLLAENTADVIWAMNLQAEFTYISPSVEALRGYTPVEAANLESDAQIRKTQGELIQRWLDKDSDQNSKKSHTILSTLECKDGSHIDVEVVVSSLHDESGAVTGIVGITRDVSGRKQLEIAMDSVLQRTRSRMGTDFFKALSQSLAETLEVKCVLIGAIPEGDQVNTLAVWMGGEFADNISYQLEGAPCANVVKPAICVYPDHVQARFPKDLLLGEMGMESYVGSPMIDPHNKTIGLVVCMDDKPLVGQKLAVDLLGFFASHAAAELARRYAESEREEIQQQLLQSQKLESIGQLAGGIAHDFNNLLGVILGYSELAETRVSDDADLAEYHHEIIRAAERAAGLTRQILSFSRRQIMESKPLDMNELILGMAGLVRRLLPENIDHTFIQGADLGVIEGDTGQLEQALMNLAVNARDAMPEGGSLTVETRNILFDQEYVDAHLWAKMGRYVSLRVTDTGMGIPPEIQEKIFEPFFTTKEEGKGTGLGLSVFFGVIKQHGGFVHLSSVVGEGTEFLIFLPVVQRSAISEGKSPRPGASRGGEFLLIAEDNRAVLKMTDTMLSQAGYEVVTAENGEEAVKLFRQHQNKLALVLLDVVLPKMGGREVCEEIHKIAPDTLVLFTTGYSNSAMHTDFILQEGLELLQKPYSAAQLTRKIRGMID